MTRAQTLTMLTAAQQAGQIDADVDLQYLTAAVWPIVVDAENIQINRRADVNRQNTLVGYKYPVAA